MNSSMTGINILIIIVLTSVDPVVLYQSILMSDSLSSKIYPRSVPYSFILALERIISHAVLKYWHAKTNRVTTEAKIDSVSRPINLTNSMIKNLIKIFIPMVR